MGFTLACKVCNKHTKTMKLIGSDREEVGRDRIVKQYKDFHKVVMSEVLDLAHLKQIRVESNERWAHKRSEHEDFLATQGVLEFVVNRLFQNKCRLGKNRAAYFHKSIENALSCLRRRGFFETVVFLEENADLFSIVPMYRQKLIIPVAMLNYSHEQWLCIMSAYPNNMFPKEGLTDQHIMDTFLTLFTMFRSGSRFDSLREQWISGFEMYKQ